MSSRFLIFLLLALASSFSSADLSNPKYLLAKNYYSSGKWQEAINALSEYKEVDGEFLSKNKNTLDAIDMVIGYCNSKLPKKPCKGVCFNVGAVTTGEGEPPKLP
ncbi:hypothetical protein [Chitinolyticbacter meiyuanensis]|uniref:hypothetical protein n=1 Tax=Chitinolyticbacter meiyuanensis TaxID=682798 RepID=UPI0011E59EB1|nr:hypothetical protein [Chitinolyticbacter meiyuanensis]